MKLLVTGGTGLIGQRFIQAFSEHDYTVLCRDSKRARKALPKPIHLIEQLSELRDLNEFDGVINLAGEPIIDKRWTRAQKSKICESRWQTTRHLVSLFEASSAPPSVFLSGSAIGIYGHRKDEVLSEDRELNPSDFPSELCFQWEKIANSAASKTRVINLRTGIVLDPQQGALSKMLLPFKLGLGGRIGDGQQYMSWIHIDDMVQALGYVLADENIHGPVNMTAPEPLSNREYTRILAETLHRPALMPVPGGILKLLLGESSQLLLDSQRVKPKELLSKGFTFRFPELKMALENLLK